VNNESEPVKQTWKDRLGCVTTLVILAMLSLDTGIYFYTHIPIVADLSLALGVIFTALLGAEISIIARG